MSLTVETGAIVSGANSWVSREDFIAYAADRGVTVADEAATDAILIKACDYINGLEPRLKGNLLDRDQPTAYPRSDLELEGWSWSSTEIPRQVINAQLSLALEINAGEDPHNPSMATLPTIRKRVEGAVEVEYANPGVPLKVQKTQGSRVHINILLRNSGMFAVRA